MQPKDDHIRCLFSYRAFLHTQLLQGGLVQIPVSSNVPLPIQKTWRPVAVAVRIWARWSSLMKTIFNKGIDKIKREREWWADFNIMQARTRRRLKRKRSESMG